MRYFVETRLLKLNMPNLKLYLTQLKNKGNKLQLNYYWPTLFGLLEMENLFENFFTLEEDNPLFKAIITALNNPLNADLLMRLYDQIFVECLTHVKNMPQINDLSLIKKIKEHKHLETMQQFNELTAPLFDYYTNYLTHHRCEAMHNLILFLAWDRVCVNLAIIFEHDPSSTSIREGLNLLKACVLESFQHITSQKKSAPSFFRLLETLYADAMRQENLDHHTEAGWKILCQGAALLKPREQLADLFFIDGAIKEVSAQESLEQDSLSFISSRSNEEIEAGVNLANYLNLEVKNWMKDWPYLVKKVDVFPVSSF